MRCPTCESQNIEIVVYHDIKCVKCLNCGFDERAEMDEGHSETKNVPDENPNKTV